MKSQLLFGAVLFTAAGIVRLQAQTPVDPGRGERAGSDSSMFAPLAMLPAPSARRLANGAPGPKYWQNRADYDLTARLDTTTGTVWGSMVLRYTNNSPDTLGFIWFHTEQNAFRDLAGPDSTHPYGDIIDEFTQIVNGTPSPVRLEDQHRSLTKVILPVPLAPGRTAVFRAAWHFVVPPHSHSFGMGREGSLYHIGKWYPSPNVYDDVTGWSQGSGGFYAEFGDFTLRVTVPSDYIVAASGTLDNPAEVLTPAEAARLKLAGTSDTTVHIVTAAGLADGSAHVKRDGLVTWKFHLKRSREMVWSASPEYLWDATHWQGISAQAFYRRQKADQWREVADMARMSVQEYAQRWVPYAYPLISVAEGPVPGGQEYPAMTFVGTFPDRYVTYRIVTHEVGHSWLPMLAGGNGEQHPWMHEGINTFISTFSQARRYPERGDQTTRADKYRAEIEDRLARHEDFVMDQYWNQLPSEEYGAYDKPAGVLQMLRRDVMGPARFDRGLKLYLRRWAYKHATPQDFFRTMNAAAGRRLDWFWREWFLESPGFDQGIDSVSQTVSKAGRSQLRIVYGNHARGVLPIVARFTFSDGTSRDVVHPAESWRANGVRYVGTYSFPHKVIKVELDPDHHFVDTDRTNNLWQG